MSSMKSVAIILMFSALSVSALAFVCSETRAGAVVRAKTSADAAYDNQVSVMDIDWGPSAARSWERYGKAVCVDLRNGYTIHEEFAAVSKKGNQDPMLASAVVDAGVRAYCPSFVPQLNAFAAVNDIYMPLVPSYPQAKVRSFVDAMKKYGDNGPAIPRDGEHICFLVAKTGSVDQAGAVFKEETGLTNGKRTAEDVGSAILNLCPRYASLAP